MKESIQSNWNDILASAKSSGGSLLNINDAIVLSSVYSQEIKARLNLISSSANESNDLHFINRGSLFNTDFEIQVGKSVSRIIELIYSDDFVEGESSKTQLYLESLYHKDRAIFLESFNRAWVSLYTADAHYITTFLNVASTIDYEWLNYRADAIVMGFNSLSNPFVNEAAIRAVESWGQKSHAIMLERMRDFEQEWVQKYKVDVLEYLRSL